MNTSASDIAAPEASFFVLRTPLLAFDELIAWGADLRSPAALHDPAALESALEHDVRVLRARLHERMSRPEVREALFLASPELLERYDDTDSEEPESSAGRNGDRRPHEDKRWRVDLAAARYFIRMCGRATPFGLFAGCTVGPIGERTVLSIRERATHRRHTRLDCDYVFSLVDRLEQLPEVRDALRYRPNSSLYRVAGSFRYAETRMNGPRRTHYLVAVTSTDYLEATLDRAQDATSSELAQALVDRDPEVALEEAEEFVRELIENQILVSDLAPAVTGPEPLDGLIERLGDLPAASGTVPRLIECRNLLADLDRAGVGNDPSRYRAVPRALESLHQPVHAPKSLTQVDLITSGDAIALGPEPIQEILRGVRALRLLFAREGGSILEEFRNAFLTRYETRQVPLVEVLDEDIGLEFHMAGRSSGRAPLLDGLGFPSSDPEKNAWTPSQQLLYRKLTEAATERCAEVVLEPDELQALGPGDRLPLPRAFAVQATLCAESAEAIDRGEFRVVMTNAVGPSGALFLGRFCHGDPDLRREVERHLRAEERHAPDALFAEIVHLPEGRVGNITARPVMREWEIPYLGRSAAPRDRQIPITDLMLSLEQERLVLRSHSLGREVIPRLTNAHNYGPDSLPIYRFLAALQQQNLSPWLMWRWGPLASAEFLPRVRFGRTILAPARWRLTKEWLEETRAVRGAERYRRAQQWREQHRAPRWVIVADNDNRLPIDLDNPIGVEVMVDLAHRSANIGVEEMLPAPDDLPARGPEGRYVHEILVPFVQPVASIATPSAAARAPVTLARTFTPGSEWLYLKLYASAGHSDVLLREIIGPVAREAVAAGAADRWFFIRYADPDRHLRLRLHGTPERLNQVVLPALLRAADRARAGGLLWRVQLDTYEREIERYGGDQGMPLAERLFWADSEAVLDLLPGLSGDATADLRGWLAMVGTDRLLQDFGLSTEAKASVTAALRESLGLGIQVNKEVRVRIGNKFRSERATLAGWLEPGGPMLEPWAAAAFERRSQRLAPVVDDLRRQSRGGALSIDPSFLISSYVHMYLNRLFRSEQQRQEYVVYEYLERFYGSILARARAAPRSEPDRREPALVSEPRT
jgi:thiopeptide-type bacteriocin biosynthesis protein